MMVAVIVQCGRSCAEATIVSSNFTPRIIGYSTKLGRSIQETQLHWKSLKGVVGSERPKYYWSIKPAGDQLDFNGYKDCHSPAITILPEMKLFLFLLNCPIMKINTCFTNLSNSVSWTAGLPTAHTKNQFILASKELFRSNQIFLVNLAPKFYDH